MDTTPDDARLTRGLLALLLAAALAVGFATAAVAQDGDDEANDTNLTNLTNDTNATNATNATNETPQAAQAAVSISEVELVNSTYFSENQTLVAVLDVELSGEATAANAAEQAENLTAAPGAENVTVANATVLQVGTDEAEAGETEMRVRLVFEGVTTGLLGGAQAALPPADNATNATNATNDTNLTNATNATDDDATANES